MANTSGTQMATGLDGILKYNNGTGSLNFYMAHGGTNFGFWAGASEHTHDTQGSVASGGLRLAAARYSGRVPAQHAGRMPARYLQKR